MKIFQLNLFTIQLFSNLYQNIPLGVPAFDVMDVWHNASGGFNYV